MSSDQYTVLVTGSSGHLGHALMLSLPTLGHMPLGIDITPAPHTHIVGDITDNPLIGKLLELHPSIVHVVHSATLHKPHVASHSKADFISTNITGTLNLLEACVSPQMVDPTTGRSRIRSFIFISTTSTFGSALSPRPGQGAVWIDETVQPVPKNIYGTTKTAAEDLCQLHAKEHKLPVIVLRTSRFFPEADDDEDRRAAMGDANLKVCELAYRRVDVQDVVGAVVCAMNKAREVGWGKYIISAPPPFPLWPAQEGRAAEERKMLLHRLETDAAGALQDAVPGSKEVFDGLRWEFLPKLDRVYDSSKAVRELGWTPEWTFEKVVQRLKAGEDWRSDLTYKIGKKGYHAVPTGVYTTEAR